MDRRLLSLVFSEHTCLILLRFFLKNSLLDLLKGSSFFIRTSLSGKNPLEGGKNGEKENPNIKGLGLNFGSKESRKTL
jgi:hypothetical protein